MSERFDLGEMNGKEVVSALERRKVDQKKLHLQRNFCFEAGLFSGAGVIKIKSISI